MGLSRVFERLYAKVYVVIMVFHEKIEVTIVTQHGESSQKSRVEFEPSQIATELHDFIQQAIAETPFFYISVLNNGINQGAIPTCSRNEAQKYTDISLCKTLCIRGRYLLYSSKYELDTIKKMFQSIGVDFIFSPFTLLERLYKDKINAKAQLYVLLYDEYLVMAIFDHSTLLFGSFERVDSGSTDTAFDDKAQEEEAIVFDLEEDGDEDGISIDDLDALDDLSDLEDLDAIHELDDFTDETLSIVDTPADEMSVTEPEMDDFGVSYQHFLLIQKRVEFYYRSDLYNSEFIESVYIADANDAGDDLKRYLEEELFLNVVIRNVSVGDELLSLSMEEVQYAL